MPISHLRLERQLREMAAVGGPPEKGMNRLAYTSFDREACDLLSAWIREMGLEVRTDGVGNMFARRPGREKGPVVMLGSHLDTVTDGGAFDGVLGVLASLEVLRVLEEENIKTQLPVELVAFACEESSRFGLSLVGSKYLTGALAPETLAGYRDKDGVSILEALEERGLIQAGVLPVPRFSPGDVKAFLELHIEQNDTLAKLGLPIGIMEKIAAPTRFRITIEGQASHSGSTPMPARRDALTAASEIVLLTEKLGYAEAHFQTVATVTNMLVSPGNMNVIPGTVVMTMEIRGTDAASKARILNVFKENIYRIGHKRKGIQLTIDIISEEDPVALDPGLVVLAREICDQLGLGYQLASSPAGHDCMAMARLVPSCLIFTRNVSGVSHNPKEWADPQDILVGTQVLYEMVKRLAGV